MSTGRGAATRYPASRVGSGTQLPETHPGFPRARGALLLAAVAVTIGLVVVAPRHSPFAMALVVVSTLACGALTLLEQRRPRLRLRHVVVALALLFAASVSVPPRASNDLWSYTIYGRIVSVHHASPYNQLPADYRSDPFFERVSPIWRHRGSVYGPAFVAFAAAGTFLAGDSPLTTRLFFQLCTAAVVAVVLALVWRRTRSPAVLIWLGLHPLFGATVVNSGQVDAFIGLVVLAAAMLVARRRGILAGVVLGLGALVKLTTLLALVGVVIWGWRQRERRRAAIVMVTTGMTVLVAYLPFLGGALEVLRGADHTVTPGSLWNAPADLLVGHDAGRELPARLLPDATLSTLFYLSIGLVAVLAVVLAWRAARQSRVEPAVGAATASFAVGAEYTLPWYGSWALPVLADRTPSPLAWVVWAHAALLLTAWKLPLPSTGTALDTALRVTVNYVLPVALFAAFVVAGLVATPAAHENARRSPLTSRG